MARLKSEASVRQFASRIGVAPGIVVGRLQHGDYWVHSRGNKLKRRLELEVAEEGRASEAAV